MKITVGGYYNDEARDAHREMHVTLDEVDGARLFPKNWDNWGVPTQVTKLGGMADIFLHQYAATRGFRPQETVEEEIRIIMERDLK